jgi:transcriptional regulator with XRE-family HTH domain
MPAPVSPPTYQERLVYLGRLVRAARERHGWRQADVAARLNALLPQERSKVSRQTIEDFEHGSRAGTNLSLPKFLALCELLAIDLSLVFVEPTSARARVAVQLQAYDEAAVDSLAVFLATSPAPAFRQRQRPPG